MTRHSLDESSTQPPRRSFTYDVDEIVDTADQGIHLASLAERKRLWWRNATINALFISAWFLFATVLSVYNKWMFSEDHFGFPYPLFVTTIHMFVQFVLAASMRYFWPKRFKPDNTPSVSDYGYVEPIFLENDRDGLFWYRLDLIRNLYDPLKLDIPAPSVSKKAFPTAVASSLDIGMSNVSLKTITLSFYTMCKSSSLIFVLLFAFLFHLEKPSWRLVGVIFLIFSGVLLMVATETKFVLEGLILVLSASAFGGLRWSLTQLLLRNRKMGLDNPAATIYWLAPSMGITLAIISAIVDSWAAVFRSAFFATLGKTMETILYLVAPGFIAFCMILSEFYIIQRTGVVPMSIAGIAKEVTTITISAWFFGDQLTPLNITGVSITICGIILFTYHKYRKSIESVVPLDGHGNPIPTDGDLQEDHDGYLELDETVRLTSGSRVSDEFEDETSSNSRRLLVSATVGEDGADDARNI
ncbi:triose-phosphate transporter family-domain-containing protein [Lyophyllum atratum]|nr:triose-phosphate transporter family-domain-containing protein [Lyophyllum atratum]